MSETWHAAWWRVLWHSLRCPASPARCGSYLGTVSGNGRTYCDACGFVYELWTDLPREPEVDR